jgi:hypothetical protein
VKQSRKGSFIESSVNVVIGYIVAMFSQFFIFPLFGVYVSLQTHLWIGVWFTVISVVRSYILRRWFNNRLHRAVSKMTKEV